MGYGIISGISDVKYDIKSIKIAKHSYLSLFLISMFMTFQSIGFDPHSTPHQWTPLNKIMTSRLAQEPTKMKLTSEQVDSLIVFLKSFSARDLVQLQKLQKTLPKTTLELLFAIHARGVDKAEAEKMAAYLQLVPKQYQIHRLDTFDENTSHIIGREWHEIDYSGEGMTWEGQKEKYAAHDITNFKTLDNLKKFFPVESQLPYFKEIYF